MSLQRLAPQAYTKETLIKAFEWLQSQDDSIKSIATSVDALISLYMKAKLQGEESLHRLSIKNFKNDLQNLASIVGDWDRSAESSGDRSNPNSTPPHAAGWSVSSSGSLGVKPSIQAQQNSDPIPSLQPNAGVTNQSAAATPSTKSSVLPPELERDLLELTRALHLSHQDETLRMALRIGIEQLKRLIHKT